MVTLKARAVGTAPITLREARVRRGLSLADLARESGLARRTISRLVNDETPPKRRETTRRVLADALELDPRDLVLPGDTEAVR
jgi:transcriptional regulator with XRE-family HTH domain